MDRTGTLPIDRRARRQQSALTPPVRQPAERRLDFSEVAMPIDLTLASAEAARCLQCPEPQPCVRACPAHNDIPRALWYVEQGEIARAAAVFRATSNMPEICSRVCPQQMLCEGSCVQGGYGVAVRIGLLERFVTDATPVPEPPVTPVEGSGRRVAVVGAGPAGITVADELSKRGHSVALFDAWPRPGGTLRYGIPEFKLPKAVIDTKMSLLEARGVVFEGNVRIGESLTIQDLLRDGFDAVFLGTGAVKSAELEIEGSDLPGVIQATPFLSAANLTADELPTGLDGLDVGARVVVVGGGDTAMDCVRSALRLGAEEVTCMYRRTEAEMPGNAKEREYARQEGVRFEWLVAPLSFHAGPDGRVSRVRAQRMQLGSPDRSGRPRPEPIPGSEFVVDCDTVVLALGYWPDPLIGETTPGIETHDWGLLTVSGPEGQTRRHRIFAAGDNVHGPDLVVTAMADARKAAGAIHRYLGTLPPARAHHNGRLAD